ncbi:hypothetical protein OIU78_010947 [Salix suchowensis]|nr:hypothetical protein OIU78_010947 [Salix suchowensis]
MCFFLFVQPGYLRELLPDSAPNQPETLQNVLDDFLSTGQGGGVIQGTASESVLVVLLAARDRVLTKLGKNALEKLVVYASDQTHSALQKACKIGGIHPENCKLLKTDSSTNYALSPGLLSKAISDDISTGLIPFFLCATVGTTSSTAVDPLLALGKIAKNNGIWFHVDAAYAGSACICPEYRCYIDGVEEADSFNMNAHKWLLTNFDCSALWVKDRNALIQALSTNPEFLKNKASQANMVVDYKDWQIPLGRRFRSLKLWMVLRLYGLENLQCYIRNHINLAKYFEGLVAADSRFEVVTPRIFSLVCFRLLPPSNNEDHGNNLNRDLLDAVNSSGKIFISHTVLSGKYILRFAVGAPLTEERHVIAAWKVLQDESTSLLGGPRMIYHNQLEKYVPVLILLQFAGNIQSKMLEKLSHGYVQMKFQLSPPASRACQVLLSFIGTLNLRNGPVSIKIVASGISAYPNSAEQRD